MVILFHSSRVYFPFLLLKRLPFSHSWWPLFPSEKLTGAVRGWDINTHMLGPAHLSATLLVSRTLFSPVIEELEPESHPSDSPKCILPSALLINHALLSHSPQHTNVLYSSSKKKKSFIFPYLLQILLHVFPLLFMTKLLRGVIYIHHLAFLFHILFGSHPKPAFMPATL